MVSGVHTIETLPTIKYSSVVSHDRVRIESMITELNYLSILACDIQNAYFSTPCYDNIWTVAGTVFESGTGKIMLILWTLLKTSGSSFIAFLSGNFYGVSYRT